VALDKLKSDELDLFFKAILALEDLAECYRFFEDVCTISELEAMSQRLKVAIMLQQGRKYQEIVDETGASTATVSRVKRCLNYGADGYTLILEKLSKAGEITLD